MVRLTKGKERLGQSQRGVTATTDVIHGIYPPSAVSRYGYPQQKNKHQEVWDTFKAVHRAPDTTAGHYTQCAFTLHPQHCQTGKASRGSRGDRAARRNPEVGVSQAQRVEIPARPTREKTQGPLGIQVRNGKHEPASQPGGHQASQGKEAKRANRSTVPVGATWGKVKSGQLGQQANQANQASRTTRPTRPTWSNLQAGQPGHAACRAKRADLPVWVFVEQQCRSWVQTHNVFQLAPTSLAHEPLAKRWMAMAGHGQLWPAVVC